jgi:S-(hydroxymethyl)glutathione dehydrogenase / alcohol dehydrogenase
VAFRGDIYNTGVTMKAKAAVLFEPAQDLQVLEIDLEGPTAHEVLVRVVGSGICGSDAHLLAGDLAHYRFPIVPGHEAAGIVEAVGAEVTMVAVDDHVLINLMPGCGLCVPCCVGEPNRCRNQKPGAMLDGTCRMSFHGQPIYHMSHVAGFSNRIVVEERGCVKIREDAPLEKVCLISCGVATGWSAVFYGAKVKPGSSAVVVGCGGVGLNVLQSLKMAYARIVVAVDIAEEKLNLAREFGATHVVNALETDPVEAVRELTGGGADFGFEVITRSTTVRQAFDATRPGGTVTIVGVSPLGDQVSLPASPGRGVINGGWGRILAWRDLPLLVDLYMDGRVKVDELISRTRPLEEVNEGFADLRAGRVARTVLLPNG